MKLLDRASAKTLARPDPVEVEVPEWECRIRIRHLTMAERIDYINGIDDSVESSVRAMGELICLTAVDADGKPLWTDNEAQTIEHRVLKLLASKAASINGLSIEEEKGNS